MDIEDSIGRLDVVKNQPNGSSADHFFNVRILRRNGGKKLLRMEEDDNIIGDQTVREEMQNGGCTNGCETLPPMASALPWNCTVYLRTWGCSHNNSDSEYMAGLLGQAGYRLTADKKLANVWLLNSCTVKTPSETQLENQVREALADSKRVVVAGCVSQASPNEPWLKDVSIVGVQQIDKIVHVVEEALKGNSVRLLSKRKTLVEMDLAMPKIRRNEFIEILAINSGCLNHCTYCKTKAARGDLRSFPLHSLVEQARRALHVEGCRELWLTSEDLGAWGRDIGHTIPDLLNALVQIIPEGCMMRLGMTNPPYILDHLEEIAEILRHPRVYSFLHIPVQSGSDAVLSDMKREYTAEHFCRIVDYMMENVPNVYIATDFICAFPTETEADFEESVQLMCRYQFPSVFINQFYPRPGTPAARLRKINTVEARRRTAEMTRRFHSYRRYGTERVGETHLVLVCERARDGTHLVGHNKCYEHILVPDRPSSLLGKWATVRIVGVSKFHMLYELIAVVDDSAEEAVEENGEKCKIEGETNSTGRGRGRVDVVRMNRNHQLTVLRWAIVGLAVILAAKFLLNIFPYP